MRPFFFFLERCQNNEQRLPLQVKRSRWTNESGQPIVRSVVPDVENKDLYGHAKGIGDDRDSVDDLMRETKVKTIQ